MKIYQWKYLLIFLTVGIFSVHAFARYTLGNWNYTSKLNISRGADVVVIARDTILYTFGGYPYTNTPYPVEHATIRASGTLSPWSIESSQMVEARGFAVGFATDTYVYAICGENASSVLTTVERSPINPDGTLGAWTTIGGCPVSFGSSGLVKYNQYVYVISGYQGFNVLPYVYQNTINSDGSLGIWTLLSSQLVVGREELSSILINTTIYVVGGVQGNGFFTTQIEKAIVYPNGQLSAFTTISATGAIHEGCGLFYDGTYLNVIGGYAGGDVNYRCERAMVYLNGSLGTWEPTPYISGNGGAFVQTTTDAYMIDDDPNGDVEYASILNTTEVKKSAWEIFE